jgi:hypothetical protein
VSTAYFFLFYKTHTLYNCALFCCRIDCFIVVFVYIRAVLNIYMCVYTITNRIIYANQIIINSVLPARFLFVFFIVSNKCELSVFFSYFCMKIFEYNNLYINENYYYVFNLKNIYYSLSLSRS